MRFPPMEPFLEPSEVRATAWSPISGGFARPRSPFANQRKGRILALAHNLGGSGAAATVTVLAA